MPFKSKAQRRRCYAEKAKNPDSKWDCAEWEEETPATLPERLAKQALLGNGGRGLLAGMPPAPAAPAAPVAPELPPAKPLTPAGVQARPQPAVAAPAVSRTPAGYQVGGKLIGRRPLGGVKAAGLVAVRLMREVGLDPGGAGTDWLGKVAAGEVGVGEEESGEAGNGVTWLGKAAAGEAGNGEAGGRAGGGGSSSPRGEGGSGSTIAPNNRLYDNFSTDGQLSPPFATGLGSFLGKEALAPVPPGARQYAARVVGRVPFVRALLGEGAGAAEQPFVRRFVAGAGAAERRVGTSLGEGLEANGKRVGTPFGKPRTGSGAGPEAYQQTSRIPYSDFYGPEVRSMRPGDPGVVGRAQNRAAARAAAESPSPAPTPPATTPPAPTPPTPTPGPDVPLPDSNPLPRGTVPPTGGGGTAATGGRGGGPTGGSTEIAPAPGGGPGGGGPGGGAPEGGARLPWYRRLFQKPSDRVRLPPRSSPGNLQDPAVEGTFAGPNTRWDRYQAYLVERRAAGLPDVSWTRWNAAQAVKAIPGLGVDSLGSYLGGHLAHSAYLPARALGYGLHYGGAAVSAPFRYTTYLGPLFKNFGNWVLAPHASLARMPATAGGGTWQAARSFAAQAAGTGGHTALGYLLATPYLATYGLDPFGRMQHEDGKIYRRKLMGGREEVDPGKIGPHAMLQDYWYATKPGRDIIGHLAHADVRKAVERGSQFVTEKWDEFKPAWNAADARANEMVGKSMEEQRAAREEDKAMRAAGGNQEMATATAAYDDFLAASQALAAVGSPALQPVVDPAEAVAARDRFVKSRSAFGEAFAKIPGQNREAFWKNVKSNLEGATDEDVTAAAATLREATGKLAAVTPEAADKFSAWAKANQGKNPAEASDPEVRAVGGLYRQMGDSAALVGYRRMAALAGTDEAAFRASLESRNPDSPLNAEVLKHVAADVEKQGFRPDERTVMARFLDMTPLHKVLVLGGLGLGLAGLLGGSVGLAVGGLVAGLAGLLGSGEFNAAGLAGLDRPAGAPAGTLPGSVTADQMAASPYADVYQGIAAGSTPDAFAPERLRAALAALDPRALAPLVQGKQLYEEPTRQAVEAAAMANRLAAARAADRGAAPGRFGAALGVRAAQADPAALAAELRKADLPATAGEMSAWAQRNANDPAAVRTAVGKMSRQGRDELDRRIREEIANRGGRNVANQARPWTDGAVVLAASKAKDHGDPKLWVALQALSAIHDFRNNP